MTIGILIFGIVVILLVLWAISTQRKLAVMDENINNAMAQIGVQLSSRFDALTAQGKKQLDEILGLKRFLLDFSLIHERGVQKTVIWQDYLI